jgi:mono/diheme cytochrome c family protein/uncharacterized membrane protein
MNELGLFLGRFHPVLVHLPIGILLLLGALELAGALRQRCNGSWLPLLPDPQRTFILALGAGIAAVTAGLGWLLSREGGCDDALLTSHRNLGFVSAGLATGLLVLHGLRARRLYFAALIITLGVIAWAGHRGGQITHGRDYLTQYAPAWWQKRFGSVAVAKTAPRPKPASLAQAHVYADVIAPILEQRCVSCHGPAKSNGDLRLDTWEQWQRGSKHGALVTKQGPSLLLQRIELPVEAKEHMPPAGKPQLTDDEIALLDWWVEAGAPHQQSLVELSPPETVSEIVATRLGFAPVGPVLPERISTLAAATALASRLQIEIRPLAADTPWLAVTARLRAAQFGDAQLRELEPIAPAIQWLDLGQTAVTDAGLAPLAAMKNLRRLQLDHTAITDAGLAHLSSLTQLESLNLHRTAITDAGLPALKSLSRLRSIYLWQTHVTPAAAQALGETLVDHRKVKRWNEQIADLQNKVRSEQFSANLGEPAFPPAPADLPKPNPPPPATIPAPAVK